jgi:hypothetical protein
VRVLLAQEYSLRVVEVTSRSSSCAALGTRFPIHKIETNATGLPGHCTSIVRS